MPPRLDVLALTALLLAAPLSGCKSRVPYHPDEPEVLLVEGVDIDQTLDVAEYRLQHLDKFQSLGLWIMRDQEITAAQAGRVSALYFEYIDTFEDDFDVWHGTWAIRNLHDGGDDEVKLALEQARADASERAAASVKIANKVVNGDALYYGDFHGVARAARHGMMVVPGDERYVQSFTAYREDHDYEAEKAKADAKAEAKSARKRRRDGDGGSEEPSEAELKNSDSPDI